MSNATLGGIQALRAEMEREFRDLRADLIAYRAASQAEDRLLRDDLNEHQVACATASATTQGEIKSLVSAVSSLRDTVAKAAIGLIAGLASASGLMAWTLLRAGH